MPEFRRAILTYHSIDESGSAISVAPHRFWKQMAALAGSGVKVAPLEELLATTPPAVALTFDDGFQNFADLAAPVLARHNLPATVFLVTAHCGGHNDWRQPRGIPRLPMIDWPRIKELDRAGFAFGAHTATHADLAELPESMYEQEIVGSKRTIEDRLGRPVSCFAYPYGSMTEGTRRLVAEHFSAGCSTRLGWVTGASRREALERLDVYYLRSPRWFGGLFGAAARGYIGLRAALRKLR